MKTKLFLVLIILTINFTVNAQNSSEKTFFHIERTKFSFQTETANKAAKNDLLNSKENSSEKASQTNQYVRPDAKKRFKRYVNNAIGFRALAASAIGAGFSTAINEPEEWKGNWEGFGRRFASNMGRNFIKETAVYGLDEALKLDSGFYRSEKKDVGSRVKNAFLSTFTARKTNGKRVIGIPRLIGTYSAHIIASETWFPKRYNYKDGLESGTISLGVNIAFNLLREFIWKK